MRSLVDLDLHQEEAWEFIKDRDKCALFLVPGKGKTVLALSWIEQRINYVRATKVLVIAPILVSKDTWKPEGQLWEHLSDLSITPVLGTEAQRLKALREDHHIYCINPENVKWLVETVKYVWDFDAIVIDEVDFFQSASSERFKKLKTKTFDCPNVMIMTGTPIGNSYLGLWAQIFLLDSGERLWGSMTRYTEAFFSTKIRDGVSESVLDDGMEEVIWGKLKDICFSLEDDSEKSFPREYIYHYVDLTLKGQELYREMSREFLIQIGDEVIPAFSAAAKTAKLLQIASGRVYSYVDPDDPDSQRKTLDVHSLKIDKCREIVKQASGNVLIFYMFQSQLEAIKEAFPDAVDVRKDKTAVSRWQRGEIEVLVAHPQSAGHGLNLQSGGHEVIFLGLPWSHRKYVQSLARLARKGQKETVKVHHILTNGTIDEYVKHCLSRHKMTSAEFFQGLKCSVEATSHPR